LKYNVIVWWKSLHLESFNLLYSQPGNTVILTFPVLDECLSLWGPMIPTVGCQKPLHAWVGQRQGGEITAKSGSGPPHTPLFARILSRLHHVIWWRG
jgi:hypothetical protein